MVKKLYRPPVALGLSAVIATCACSSAPATPPVASSAPAPASAYFDNTGRDDVLSGGVKMIPIKTPKGIFQVWTKRVGNNPTVKVLLLHGGPGATHEYLEAFDSYFPAAGIEYYYYDQLGSDYSDQPNEPELWDLPRFVDEVEQVRRRFGLDHDNFYLLGHSWGGLLAIEYALKHQQHLKGLVISNMMASIPAYNDYAQKVLMPEMDQTVLAEVEALEAAGKLRPIRATWSCSSRTTTSTISCACRPPNGRSGESRVQAPQPVDLRPDAGPERARCRAASW